MCAHHAAVRPTTAVAAIHELLLRAVEWHQIVERVTMIWRRLDALLSHRRRQLLIELVMVMLLHQRELIQFLATSGSLEVCEARCVGAEAGERGALVAAIAAAVRLNVVVLHRTLAMNFW